MKYAVIYLSKTGNTQELAKNIYVSLPGNDKTIIDAEKMSELPEAEFYFVGFPIKNRVCGIEIMNILEQLGNVKVALFASCGLPANDKYKQYIENAVSPWINDETDYKGLYLCQGKASGKFRKILEVQTGYPTEDIDRIMETAAEHPDDNDISKLYEFVDSMIE
ncbi:MAG: flavodoxin family protein [Huintestinicola sp.]